MNKEAWDKLSDKEKKEIWTSMKELRHAIEGYKLRQSGIALAKEIKAQPTYSKDRSLQEAYTGNFKGSTDIRGKREKTEKES